MIYFHALTSHPQTANNDSISRLNSRPKIPFPGNGKGNYKMPREGKFEACIPENHRKREFPLTPAERETECQASKQCPFGGNKIVANPLIPLMTS